MGSLAWTAHHSAYWAALLTQRGPSGDLERLSASLATAKVDLNPHQVDAALFAIQSPLSKGVILADEVGLGKTIEAAIVIAQRWAERKRRVLLIVPATLRKQWQQELLEKFALPTEIIESPAFRRNGIINAFDHEGVIGICSYQLAAAKAFELTQVSWDLIVIDEAHRLRNVYKKSSRIAASIRDALAGRQKLLLTATPLQNSLMELYGLASVADPHIFGDERSFREQFSDAGTSNDAAERLKERIALLCKRTLRKQVLEYVQFTERRCLTREFYPTDEEQQLYEEVSDYLRRPALAALPESQRQLITEGILLDFFAGSGSSAHAVVEMNRRDAGRRKFVLVQLPEPVAREDYSTVAQVARERIRRVIRRISEEPPEGLDFEGRGDLDLGFRSFRLSESGFKIWNAESSSASGSDVAEQLSLHIDHVLPDRSQEDILFEILLKAGYPLTADIQQVKLGGQSAFSISAGNLIVCLESRIAIETLRAAANLNPKPVQVICLDHAFEGNDQLKTNIVLEMEAHDIRFRTV